MGQGYVVNFNEPHPLLMKLTISQVGLDFLKTLLVSLKPPSRDNQRKGLIEKRNNVTRIRG